MSRGSSLPSAPWASQVLWHKAKAQRNDKAFTAMSVVKLLRNSSTWRHGTQFAVGSLA